MKNKTVGIIIMMFLTLIVAAGLIVLNVKSSYESALEKPNSDSTETVKFEIMAGESIDTIVPSLINQELLKEEHRNYFLYYLKSEGLIPSIQAGSFEIPRNLTIIELAETLQRAQEPSIWVTIPEGLRMDEVADIIVSKLKNVDKNMFLNAAENADFIESLNLGINTPRTLEGFLHPDRYLFKKDSTEQEVILTMVENFQDKVNEGFTYEDIVLASLIEREAVDAEDRRIISGILQKRIREQWLLQVDATLLYHHKNWGHIITVGDKELDHVYNTYKFPGLPPQPICNPGLDSIQSISEPTETDYYYYIHDNDRNPHYSRTLQEHEEKVQRYLR